MKTIKISAKDERYLKGLLEKRENKIKGWDEPEHYFTTIVMLSKLRQLWAFRKRVLKIEEPFKYRGTK